jgi:SAM-dependent methyltransferase
VNDDELKLLGNLAGKRVLELGCSDAHAAITVAAHGAHVIAIAGSPDAHDRARAAIEAAEAKVELHRGDLADLAFIRADTVDAAFSDGALREVDDLDRVFRQVHRVLKTDAALVVSFPHPIYELVQERHSYFDRSGNRRTVGDLFASLDRAHFVVDTLLEPDTGAGLPLRLVLRGRKLGN